MIPVGTWDPSDPGSRARRRDYIGASELARVLGLGNTDWGGPLSVYVAKVGQDEPLDDNENMALGRILEARAMGLLEERLPTLEPAAMLCPNTMTYIAAQGDRLSATPDGLIRQDAGLPCERELPVEVKFTARGGEEWADLAAWLAGNGPVPQGTQLEGYWCQMQSQLAVTGAPYGYLCGIIGDRAAAKALAGLPLTDEEFRVIRVERDEIFVAKAQAACKGFFARHVLIQVPPPATAADADAVRRAYRHAKAGMVKQADGLVDHFAALDEIKQRLSEANAAVKALDAEADAHKAAIQAVMGEAELMGCGEWTAKWTTVPAAVIQRRESRRFSWRGGK